MAKMWAGRTSGVTDSIADDFNSSIHFDCKMYKQDITGSMAHAAMLGAKNIISKKEADTLIDGLQGILDDLDSGALEFDFTCEDIHMFVEQVLTQRLGDVGKKLHTARSRNDQVALDLRMYLREEVDEITELVKDVIHAILEQAQANKTVIMPGYTHLQRAQPILFSHHLLAYAMMLLRDLERLADCRKRMNVSPIGCCALAGTTYNTDRRCITNKRTGKLGELLRNEFNQIYKNGSIPHNGYPEQFDTTYDFVPKMCELDNCSICPFNAVKGETINQEKLDSLCIETSGKYCPLVLLYCGYFHKCPGSKQSCKLMEFFNVDNKNNQ